MKYNHNQERKKKSITRIAFPWTHQNRFGDKKSTLWIRSSNDLRKTRKWITGKWVYRNLGQNILTECLGEEESKLPAIFIFSQRRMRRKKPSLLGCFNFWAVKKPGLSFDITHQTFNDEVLFLVVDGPLFTMNRFHR